MPPFLFSPMKLLLPVEHRYHFHRTPLPYSHKQQNQLRYAMKKSLPNLILNPILLLVEIRIYHQISVTDVVLNNSTA